MNLHKCILLPGIRTSERFGRLNWLQRDLFYGLLAVANKGGWFENNAANLRAALYAPCLGKLDQRDLKHGLLKLQEVGLIKLWVGRNGRAYGAIINYRQKYEYGEELPADAHPPDDELRLAIEEPPDRAIPPDPPKNTIEVSRVEPKARKARHTPPTDDEAWLEALAQAHAGIDVRAEYRKASKRYPLGFGRKFFEDEWLARAEPPIKLNGQQHTSGPIEPEPEGWRQFLKDRYEDESWAESAAAYPWAQMPANWRTKITRELLPRA
jgi:hypothetical protein